MIRTFTVPGKAVGKQVARISGRKGQGRHGHTPTKTAEYMARIRKAYLDDYPNSTELQGPLGITVTEYRRRPKHHYRKVGGQTSTKLHAWAPCYCSTTPDLSNLMKAVEDAIQSNPKKHGKVCYKNDAQIAFYRDCSQVYINRRDMEPWIFIEVYELESHGSCCTSR